MDIDQHAPYVFGAGTFDALTASAASAARSRINLDLHEGPDHPAQRFLNAVEPASYIRPHRHALARREETFCVLRGAFGLVLFGDAGTIARTVVLRAGGELVGAHLPTGVFHTLVSLAPGSIMFEVKAGPYDASTAKEWATWAPAEGAPEACAYLETLRSFFSEPAG